jgi:hypothetical protein
MDQTQKIVNPFIAFLIFGAILVLMSCSEIYGRALIEIDGIIINKEVVCQQPNNNRCVTNYLLRPVFGESQSSYSAGPTDQSLSRDLPVGTKLKKKKWGLNYEIDGKVVDDFPIFFYAGLLVIGLLSIGIWFLKRKSL